MATPPFQIRVPRPYSVGDDFALWIRCFEAYAHLVRIPDDKLSDALLALLDDAEFWTYDLLGLNGEVVRGLQTAVGSPVYAICSNNCNWPSGVEFLFGQRRQEAGETLDDFADALIHLTNCSYPSLESKLRMELARDRFLAGVRREHIQEALLKSLPDTLDDARGTPISFLGQLPT